MSTVPLAHVTGERSIEDADRLRSPDTICKPDPRSHYLVRLDGHMRTPHRITELDQHAAIGCYRLNAMVPHAVAVHFETAKNLYLYAWLVFRFYPVAEQQALASLEFALRERLADFINECKRKTPRLAPPSLRKLLKNATEQGLLKNELLQGRDQWALELAKQRFRMEGMREMIEAGMNEMGLDDSEVRPTEEDLRHDWLRDFVEVIPGIRNDYAHGSSTLHHSVLRTFDLVSQMINQLFPKAEHE